MLDFLLANLEVIVALGLSSLIAVGAYWVTKTKNTLDDAALNKLKENQDLVEMQLNKMLRNMLESARKDDEKELEDKPQS